MSRFLLVVCAVCILACCSLADEFPVFSATQGQAVVTNCSPANVTGCVQFSFSGTGFSLTGIGVGPVGCNYCFNEDPGATVSSSVSSLELFLCCGTLRIGTTTYMDVVFPTSLSITGPNFVLPAVSQSNFIITLPVLFSGQFLPCEVDEEQQACRSGASLATINVNGQGTVQLTFIRNGNFWSWEKAVYHLGTVPEPSSITLFGMGMLGLIAIFRRRQTSG